MRVQTYELNLRSEPTRKKIMTRKIFGTKIQEAVREWRDMHNE
jgi:hypothetical protein